MSSIELSDETLYKDGIYVQKKYEQLKTIEEDSKVDYDMARAELADFFASLDDKTITYLFRLSILSNGNKLTNISEMILDFSNNDKISTYKYILDKEYLPYYRFFAKLGDYKSLATILAKRGIDDSQILDFRDFYNNLDIYKMNELINDIPDGNYEKIFFLAHNC